MDIFSLLSLCGGLALFLYGMTTLSDALRALAGGRAERALRRAAADPLRGVLFGAGLTAAMQSSSAVTVLLVGLAEAGVLESEKTAGLLMGSNIGSTLTGWLSALAGLESANLWLRLLRPETLSPLAALSGVLLLWNRRERVRGLGRCLMGFSLLLCGMERMRLAMAPLGASPAFLSALTLFRSPLAGVLAGALFTGVLQSSAAALGLLQALAMTGAVTYGAAVPVILGQNIGTCSTALLAAAAAGRRGRQVAASHVAFNLFGSVLALTGLGLARRAGLPALDARATALGLAACHTAFNAVTAALLLPFVPALSRGMERRLGHPRRSLRRARERL